VFLLWLKARIYSRKLLQQAQAQTHGTQKLLMEVIETSGKLEKGFWGETLVHINGGFMNHDSMRSKYPLSLMIQH
jgi:hypothetical protein